MPPRIRVLIAEDHPFLRSALRKVLEPEPCLEVVGEAADGEQAVRLAGELQADVVLMDMRLPRLDGVAATRQIAASLPHVRVIGMSLYAAEKMSELLAAGAAAILPKGASPEEIISAICETG